MASLNEVKEMKLIAHRGGSFGRENSLETIIYAAKAGADLVECDIRQTKDGEYVIFHDPNLLRLTGVDAEVSEITAAQMAQILESHGQKLLTFRALAEGYREKAPILLHIKPTDYDEAFAKKIVDSGLPLVVGVVSLPMLECFAKLLPREKILAFLPEPAMAKEFFEAGAGIIRLWEHWLVDVTPDEIRAQCPGAEVFIMAYCKEEMDDDFDLSSMDGSVETLEKVTGLKADGILLNNIDLALQWKSCKIKTEQQK